MKFERIGNIFPIIRNGANIKQDKVTDGYPITRIETIADGTVDLNRVGYASIHDESYSEFYLKENDILMSHINSVSHLGKVALVNGIETKVIHGMNLLCLKADEKKIHPKYAFYFFKSPVFRTKIKRITKKSVNQASFNISNLKDIELPLPQLSDQLHIANLLSKAEKLIAQRKESIRLLDEFLKSTFLDMFGSLRESKFQTTYLENVSVKITDGTHNSPKFLSKGVPFLLVSNIIDNEIVYDTKKYISEEEYLLLNKRTPVEIGDILITSVGTYGNPAIVKTITKFAFQRHIAYIKPNHNKIDKTYLFGSLRSDFVQSQIEKVVRGVAQKTLNLSELRKLQIPLPPIELQTQFARIVEKTEVLKSQYQQSLQELEQLYGSLSQRAFRGELRNNKAVSV